MSEGSQSTPNLGMAVMEKEFPQLLAVGIDGAETVTGQGDLRLRLVKVMDEIPGRLPAGFDFAGGIRWFIKLAREYADFDKIMVFLNGMGFVVSPLVVSIIKIILQLMASEPNTDDGPVITGAESQ